MASLLKGSAFITGAASGIGQHTALAFAKHGITRLALADLNASALKTSVAALKEAHPKIDVFPLTMNVRNTAEVKDALSKTVGAFGRLDVAVNNAGIGGSGVRTHETEEEEWARVLDVNLHGVWRCQKEELSIMVKQEDLGKRLGRGVIINVASMYGTVAPSNRLFHTAYAASKHGVIGLTKADANSYGDQNIRINAICPGYVGTPLLVANMQSNPGTPLHADIDRTPLRRMATMEEIGESIVLIASPMNSFMHGTGVVVDGGFTSN